MNFIINVSLFTICIYNSYKPYRHILRLKRQQIISSKTVQEQYTIYSSYILGYGLNKENVQVQQPNVLHRGLQMLELHWLNYTEKKNLVFKHTTELI